MAADILVLASIYVLLALGYVIVYRTSRVLNFAHGEVFMVGGYLVFALVTALSLTPMLALPVALAGGALTGVVIYAVLMAPMAGHSIFAAVLVTIGLGIIVKGATLIAFSGQIIYPGRVLGVSNEPITILPGFTLARLEIYIVLSVTAITAALIAFFRYSNIGIRMRAAAEDSASPPIAAPIFTSCLRSPGASRPPSRCTQARSTASTSSSIRTCRKSRYAGSRSRSLAAWTASRARCRPPC